MAVLDFEAYELEYLCEGKAEYDENGDLYKAQDKWVYLGRCNAVPAGSNNVIQLPDGRAVTFSFTINAHCPCSYEFKYGERLRLTTVFGKETKELTVKGFARYQHQIKIFT